MYDACTCGWGEKEIVDYGIGKELRKRVAVAESWRFIYSERAFALERVVSYAKSICLYAPSGVRRHGYGGDYALFQHFPFYGVCGARFSSESWAFGDSE